MAVSSTLRMTQQVSSIVNLRHVELGLEHTNLADSLPDVKASLMSRLETLVGTAYQTNEDGETNCRDPVETMQTLYNGFWGPFCGTLPPSRP